MPLIKIRDRHDGGVRDGVLGDQEPVPVDLAVLCDRAGHTSPRGSSSSFVLELAKKLGTVNVAKKRCGRTR